MALSLPQAEEFQALFFEALPDGWKPIELGRERLRVVGMAGDERRG
jgi:hypothetical protein